MCRKRHEAQLLLYVNFSKNPIFQKNPKILFFFFHFCLFFFLNFFSRLLFRPCHLILRNLEEKIYLYRLLCFSMDGS